MSKLFNQSTIKLTSKDFENILKKINESTPHDDLIKKIYFLWRHGDYQQRNNLLSILDPMMKKHIGFTIHADAQEKYFLLSELCDILKKLFAKKENDPYRIRVMDRILEFCSECVPINGNCLVTEQDPRYQLITKMYDMLRCVQDTHKTFSQKKNAVNAFQTDLLVLKKNQEQLTSKQAKLNMALQIIMFSRLSMLMSTILIIPALPLLIFTTGIMLLASVISSAAILLMMESLFKNQHVSATMSMDKFNQLEEKVFLMIESAGFKHELSSFTSNPDSNHQDLLIKESATCDSIEIHPRRQNLIEQKCFTQ